MPLTSDITINAANFHPDNATKEMRAICDLYEKATGSKPRWYEAGAQRYREMMENGEIEGLKPGMCEDYGFFLLLPIFKTKVD